MADEKVKTPAEKEPKAPPPPPPDGGQKFAAGAPKDVPIKPDATAEDDDGGDAGDSAGPPETRQDRKNARAASRQADEAKEEARKAREEALLYRAKLEAQQVHIESLKAVLPQQPSQVDRQLEELGRQQEALLAAYQARGANNTPEQVTQARAEYQRMADQRARLIAQSVAPQAHGPSPEQIQGMIQEAQLRAKYSDVYGQPEALAYANAIAARYQREGKVGPDAVEAVMQETRKRLGIGRGANGHSVEIDNARFAGVPTGAAPMRGTPTTYRMTAAEQKMAHAQYTKDAPEVAESKWAAKTGKKILSKQARS